MTQPFHPPLPSFPVLVTKADALREILDIESVRQAATVTMSGALDHIVRMLRENPVVPQDKVNKLIEFLPRLVEENLEKLIDETIAALDPLFTEEEALAFAEFYRSPMGRMVKNKGPVMLVTCQQIGAQWGAALAPRFESLIKEVLTN